MSIHESKIRKNRDKPNKNAFVIFPPLTLVWSEMRSNKTPIVPNVPVSA
jgi:hypothetical protein